MTYGPVHQSGQSSAVERRLRDARQGPVGRGHAPPFAKVRPLRTSSLPVSGGSGTSGPIGQSLRGYGTDDAKAPGGNGTSSSGACEKQWADDGGNLRTSLVRAAARSQHDVEPDSVVDRVRPGTRSGGAQRVGLRR